MADWLSDAVFYEIYPQSFLDTNGDGIGDIPGIIEKLDYILGLGCNALWLNPCFDSPFRDAGYDVRDYKKVAPRYGTNDDLIRLFDEAHRRGMHVLLDLVAGHTSEEHPWFVDSAASADGPYADRYIWTDYCFGNSDGLHFVGGESPRNGCYILNFFKCQPALNYGFLHPTQPWQKGMDDPAPVATREALKDVMRFWLDQGCDGFRVDMAASLVKKDDSTHSGTRAVWREIRAMLDREYPDARLVAEWGWPPEALDDGRGFHMDFMLSGYAETGYRPLTRDYENGGCPDNTYFRRDAPDRDIRRFLHDYLPWYEATKGKGYISLITGNHDIRRIGWKLGDKELKLAYAFLFTMPGVPFLYYGDEIGMTWLDLPDKEGGYFRTGARTPMQWDAAKPNLGFSDAQADRLYLPVDPAEDAPTVRDQEGRPESLLETVRSLLALRHARWDLQADAPFEVVCDSKGLPFVYRRGKLTIAVNPSGETQWFALDREDLRVAWAIGAPAVEGRMLTLPPQSFALLEPSNS